MKVLVAGVCYAAIHNAISGHLSRRWVLPRNGRRLNQHRLAKKHAEYGATSVRVGVVAGLAATLLMVFPTGDGQGKMVAEHQRVTLAAMEGLFETATGAPINTEKSGYAMFCSSEIVTVERPMIERMLWGPPGRVPRDFLLFS
jgi:hypothetical protein